MTHNGPRLVDGRFRITHEAGRGAFGTVYRAIDTTAARDVALKVLDREATDFARFEREAEVLATVRHPNVVSYVAHGLTDEGAPYLAMEWLEGVDLAERIAHAPLSIRDALVVAVRAAQGLGAAHALGIVHRDVKPSNLYLIGGRPEGVRVIDFGIARVPAAQTKLTTTGALIGTPAYMAPEQVRGAQDLTARVDVFALGCVLFECLTGSPPFVEPNANALFPRLRNGSIPRLSEHRRDTPAVLDALLARMLADDPADRFTDAAAVAMAVSGILTEDASSRAFIGGPVVTDRSVPSQSSMLVQTSTKRELPAELEAVLAAAGAEVRHRTRDAVVVAFTGDHAADGALRAARCALALRDRDATIRLAISAVRGDAIVSSTSSVLDRAGASPDDARAGELLLDTATAHHLGDAYEIERREGRALLLGPRTRSSGAASPFVGRSRELATLEGTCAEVVNERCARIALVLGEAGIGKSRLLAEMLRRLSSTTPGMTVMRALADRPTSTSPFAIIAQLLQRWARTDAAPARQRLRTQGLTDLDADFLCELAALPHDDAEAPHLVAARRDPMIMADGFRSAWQAFLDATLATGALLLTIEDLQHADPPSVRLIDVALEQFADRPLLIVATARPDEAASTLAVYAARCPERIELKPLRSSAAAELVRAALSGATTDVVDRLVESAAGNPLRLMELARLGADGASPVSALGPIERRLARLDTFARRVLRAGSVFGVRFPTAGLFTLLGGETRRADIQHALERVDHEGFVARVEGGPGDADEHWTFRHGLVQECAYATLDPEERREAHAEVGRWLGKFAGMDPSLVAWHFRCADEHESAFAWYEAAARAALQGRDLERTLVLVEEALACRPGDDDLARVLLLRAEAAFHRGDATSGKQAAMQAMEAARPGSATWTSAAGVLVTSAGQRGDNVDLARLADTVRSQSPGPDAAAPRVVCLCRAATQLSSIGDHASARSLLAEVERVDSTDPVARAWVHRLRAMLLVLEHDYDAALEVQGTSVYCFAAAGDVRGACLGRILRASVSAFAADFDAAAAELEIAEHMARRSGAEYFVRWAAYTRGKIAALAGPPASAREQLERVRRDLAGNPRIIAGTHVYGALAALRVGDGAWAVTEARAALAAHNAPATRAAALAALARALVLTGEAAEALDAATEASAMVRALGTIEENESLVYLAAIEAPLACGQEERAGAAAREALHRLSTIAGKLRAPARQEAYLQSIDTHAQTLRVAFRLGLSLPSE